jgi:predicted transport protein
MSYQAYLDSIKAKTGKSPEDFRALAEQRGLLQPGVKARVVVQWLKDDFGLGHGHAMAMYGTIRPADTPPLTADEAVASHFAGRRAGWQKTYDQLMAKISKFGPDVSIQPAKSYLSIVRASKKFAIIQVTAERFDVGIKLKGGAATDRLTESGRWNAMVTHRVRIADPTEINTELLCWLRSAYDKA